MSGKVVYEFSDDNDNTYQIIEWDKYVEISLVLVNVEKSDVNGENITK